MRSPIEGKLYLDLTPLCGEINMKHDETLLQRAIDAGETSLRFYRWSEPTLSLVYLQEKRETELPKRFEKLPRVRRLSGGGAILHDQEITYSFALPAAHPLSSTPRELYCLAHRAIIEALSQQGVSARMRGEEQKEINSRFLCFLRGDCHDLIIGEHKILGSAQRRRKGAILQHGSLILKQSVHAPEVPGVAELASVELDQEQFCRRLIRNLSELAQTWSAGSFSLCELPSA